MGIRATTRADMRGVAAKAARICTSEPFGLFLANEAMRGMNPYVPFRDGVLAGSAKAEPFAVTYSTPYAAKVYYGRGMAFRKDRHPLASAEWNVPYEQAHKGELAAAGTGYLRNGGRL